jgi:hypothetical protein
MTHHRLESFPPLPVREKKEQGTLLIIVIGVIVFFLLCYRLGR